MESAKCLVGLAGLLALAACTVPPPTGPSVVVMPGQGKTFEQFQGEDAACRSAASASLGGATPAQAATQSTVGSALVGAGLGAAAGALAGSTTASAGTGAAVGAGIGGLLGTAVGAGAGRESYAAMQRQYDITYVQCMAAQGNQVPQPTAAPRYYYPYPPYYSYGPYPYRSYPYP